MRTFLNIGFPLITFPYITRILSPYGLGIYDFNKSIVSYFILIAGLGISQYAVREGSKKKNNLLEFQKFCNQIFTINIISTIVAYLLMAIMLVTLKQGNDSNLLIIIFSIQLIFNLLSVEWLFLISEDFKYITIRSFIIQLLSLILLFTFVKNQNDYFNYAIITVFSMGISSLFNISYSRKFVKLRVTSDIESLKSHLKPVFILFFNNIASTIYLSSDVTIIGIISGNYYVGLYSTAVKIYTIVKQLINTVLMTTIPRLAFLNNEDKFEYEKLLVNVFNMILLLIAPAIVGLIMLRRQVVLIIAGNEYIRSVSSLLLLSICLFFAVFSAFFVHGILLINNREKIILKITVASAVINIILNLLLVPKFNENGAAVATLISEFIVLMMSIYYSKDIFKIKIENNTLFSIILGSIMIIVICEFTFLLVSSIILQMFISILLSLVIYFFILKIFKTLPSL